MTYLTFKYTVTLKPGLGVTQGHRNRLESIRRLRRPIYVQLKSRFFSYSFREKPRFQLKIANFSHPRVFCTHLELDTDACDKNGPGREKSLTIFSVVWIQYMNLTEGRSDRATAMTALTHSVAR